MASSINSAALNTTAGSATRLLSLDTLRGGTIALMVWVNHTFHPDLFTNPTLDAVHRQWFHIPWNDPAQGVTAADIVFPLFLFAAGASVPLSMKFGRGRDRKWWRTLLIALKRGVVLYMLGVLLTVASAAYTRPLVWGDLLSWNILQLIAAAYVVCVGVFLLPRWWQVGIVSTILLAKWGVMTLVPYDSVAELGAARAAEGAPTGTATWQHYQGVKEALNAPAIWFDRLVGWTSDTLFGPDEGTGDVLRDDRLGGFGWFGGFQQALPAAAIAVFGGWSSLVLVGSQGVARKLLLVLGGGVALVLLALLLSGGYDASGTGWVGRFTVPSSKWFFSVPYCLLSAGIGMIVLSPLWWICDVKRWTTLFLLRVFGLNAIALYLGSEMLFKCIIARWSIHTPAGDTANLASGLIAWTERWTTSRVVGSLAWPVIYMTLWWLVLFWMDRRKLYLKV